MCFAVDLAAAAWQTMGKDEIKASTEHFVRKFVDMTVCRH
jgi:hypothetical protein